MQVVHEIRRHYEGGTLVPFLGSGMSRKVCRDWAGMIAALEYNAGVPEPAVSTTVDDLDLTRRAARALERLRFDQGVDAASAVRRVLLEQAPADPPEQTRALARGNWPLVLTTNYDDLYLAAVHQHRLDTRLGSRPHTPEAERRAMPLTLAGRSSSDVHRVLSALATPSQPMLWALQGFVGGQALIHSAVQPEDPHVYCEWVSESDHRDRRYRAIVQALERQVVVGHADYRRAALRSESFRRAFAEVFRRRSLLFLGAGLRDRYLLDLLGQVIELHGANAHAHYAIARAGSLDVEFLRRHFGIWVHEIADTPDLAPTMDELISMPLVDGPVVRWDYRTRPSGHGAASRLSVETAGLPPTLDASSCIVISGGGSRSRLRLSDDMRSYLIGAGCVTGIDVDDRRWRTLFRRLEGRTFVWRLGTGTTDGDRPLVLAARARLDPGSDLGRAIRPTLAATGSHGKRPSERDGRLWRDVRLVRHVMHEVLDVAHEAGRTNVVSSVLAAGSLRVTHPSHTVLEMVRAWGTSRLRDDLSLSIYVVEPDVVVDLRSGRLDPARVLPVRYGRDAQCSIQFWLEIVERGGGVQRLLRMEDPQRGVRSVLQDYAITGDSWHLDPWPRPCLAWRPWSIAAVRAWEAAVDVGPLTLERFGVLHGSTLRVTESGQA